MSEYNEKLCDEKHTSIDEKLETHERRLNDHDDRLKKLENESIGTAHDMKNFKEILDTIKVSVEKISIQLENLKEKPAKRWDSLVDKIITVVVGAIIGYFFSKF